MSKNTKLWMIAATSLILVGGIVFGGVMTVLHWDFTKLSTVKYETNDYVINEDYKNISIVTNTADIVLVPSENLNTSVICYEQNCAKHSVSVTDGTLSIELLDTRKWYEHIGITFGTPKITVFIPRGEYGSVSVRSSTGNVEMPKDFHFENIDVSASTGDVTNYASVSRSMKIKTSTGDIYTENVSAGMLDLSVTTGKVTVNNVDCEGDVNITVSTGKTALTDLKCKNIVTVGNTGNISFKNVIVSETLSVERSTGTVKLDGCDASEIFIKTDTGDVSGSLLSEKVFIVQTDTGNVDVPKTINGGKCEIVTDTGDIKISILY